MGDRSPFGFSRRVQKLGLRAQGLSVSCLVAGLLAGHAIGLLRGAGFHASAAEASSEVQSGKSGANLSQATDSTLVRPNLAAPPRTQTQSVPSGATKPPKLQDALRSSNEAFRKYYEKVRSAHSPNGARSSENLSDPSRDKAVSPAEAAAAEAAKTLLLPAEKNLRAAQRAELESTLDHFGRETAEKLEKRKKLREKMQSGAKKPVQPPTDSALAQPAGLMPPAAQVSPAPTPTPAPAETTVIDGKDIPKELNF